MIEVTITRRSDDFHACLTGDDRIWDCGKSPAEAVGNLVITHANRLGVDLSGVISAPAIETKSHMTTSIDAALRLNPSLGKAAMVEILQKRYAIQPAEAWVVVSRYWNERGK